MTRFTDDMVPERVQPFWAALQRGEFITDAAAEAGTYRKRGTRWLAGNPRHRARTAQAVPWLRGHVWVAIICAPACRGRNGRACSCTGARKSGSCTVEKAPE